MQMLQERSADIGSRTVRYLEAGAGWPLVLLHAFPLSADMWRPQLDAPPEGWRLLAPDLSGFGPLAGPPAGTMAGMAGEVSAWLDALRIDRAVIGGLSMGGYVAFALYRLAPERFSGLLLANTRASADTDEGRAGRERMLEILREGGTPAVAEAMLPKLLGRTVAGRPELRAHVRRLIEANAADAVAGALRAMRDRPDSTPMLADVHVPALLVAGEEDVLVPRAEAEEMHARLPRAQLVVLPRAGHLSNLESPADFSEVLGNFLRANL